MISKMFTQKEETLMQKCMQLMLGEKFIEEWEFPIIFGIEKEELKAIYDKFPDIDWNNKDEYHPVTFSAVNLIFYPHGRDLLRYDIKEEELISLLEKFKRLGY